MTVLAILTWITLFVLKVPNATLLALQAGLLTFVPYLGALVAGVPILVMALPLGQPTALLAVGLYIAIHFGIGYIVLPLIQQRTVRLPPAFALAALVVFGVLFGMMGAAVATPLVVAIRQVVLRLHDGDPAVPGP